MKNIKKTEADFNYLKFSHLSYADIADDHSQQFGHNGLSIFGKPSEKGENKGNKT